MWLTRSLGVQLHPTSLPGGRLGPDALAFVDWLAAAGARWWQVLPLHPPDAFGSPYASASAFAGWDGLLADPEARVTRAELRTFERRNAFWARDWAKFAGDDALATQVRFDREWAALREYARRRGIGIVGDVPIYVASGGCDHRAHPGLFLPDDLVAGAPPDALSADGQTWGNPLYDWAALRADGFGWWVERLRRTLSLVDAFRLDHFRGFAAFWAVPAAARTAREGRWLPGPGAAVFEAATAELGTLPAIAEDLGVITPDVVALRETVGLPGMAVLIWAFEGRGDSPHRIANHAVHQVVYTSTHDTDTLRGRFPDRDPWQLVALGLSSRAALAVVPVQDVLGLGSEARMNRPGTSTGNWQWSLEPGQLGDADAARLRAAAEATGRA
jgi:4-alpha-glucanotransferase